MGEQHISSPLSLYRVLDISEGGCNLAGRVLADLGAEVIRIEPPHGSDLRKAGPFYHDHVHPEASLPWLFFNLNKMGVTLDMALVEGRRLFEALGQRADIVVQGNIRSLKKGPRFGYEELSRINPQVILTSISPFGLDGPRAEWEATDMVIWATSGMQYVQGDPDRAPLRASVPLAEAVAATQACAGTMHALWQRAYTNEGQHVSVSAQMAAIWTTMNEVAFPVARNATLRREGTSRKWASISMRQVYRCSDGYVVVYAPGGTLGAASMEALTRWMAEEGIAPDFMASKDWGAWDLETTAVEEVSAMEQAIERFVAGKTKGELYERSVRDRILVGPCYTTADLSQDPQLRSRAFWVAVEHPEMEQRVEYPGPFAKLSGTPAALHRPAPRLGEHNYQVYCGLLGLSSAELRGLRARGVI